MARGGPSEGRTPPNVGGRVWWHRLCVGLALVGLLALLVGAGALGVHRQRQWCDRHPAGCTEVPR